MKHRRHLLSYILSYLISYLISFISYLLAPTSLRDGVGMKHVFYEVQDYSCRTAADEPLMSLKEFAL